MRITAIEKIKVIVPARPDTVNSPEARDPMHMLVLDGRPAWQLQFDQIWKYIYRVQTDEGIEGLGESYRGVNPQVVDGIIASLIGVDPMKLNLRDLPVAWSREYDGFEAAFFDLVGKKLGVPAYRLLGGAYRETVEVDFWTGRRTSADAIRKAREGFAAGFHGIKFKCNLEDDVVAWAEGVRSACGPAFRIVFDPNTRFERPAEVLRFARQLEAVGNVQCLEDPVPRWNLQWYRLLREKTTLPIALHVALPYLELGQMLQDTTKAIQLEAVDYFNFNCGIANFVRMADVADAAGIPCWHGSEVDLGILEASYLHACAAARNCTLRSDVFGELVREDDLIVEPIAIQNARARVPQGPGLGVELDREALEKYRVNLD
ncbi:MAG TPA: enolase C-terminal domain-like protein [Terriglobia bacterium]|nr:enolase C-terminal domain-like protein [Terriglobia bacterium]